MSEKAVPPLRLGLCVAIVSLALAGLALSSTVPIQGASQNDPVLMALLRRNLELYRQHKPIDLKLTMSILFARGQETGEITRLDAYVRSHEAELIGYTLPPSVEAEVKKLTGLTVRDVPALTATQVEFVAQHGVGYLMTHWQDTNIVEAACTSPGRYALLVPVALPWSPHAGGQPGCADPECISYCQAATNMSALVVSTRRVLCPGHSSVLRWGSDSLHQFDNYM